jgi:putative spermidine/putrescine transport system substrate-binding protein
VKRGQRGAGKRRISALVAALGVAAAMLTACGSGSSTVSGQGPGVGNTVLGMPDLKGQTIVINTYGGTFADAFRKDVVNPFEAATGAKVTLATNCCDTFETMTKAGQFSGDIVLGNDYGPMSAWGSAGLFKSEPRLTQIAKARGMDPDYYQDNLIAVDFYAYVLAWNTKYADNRPNSWTDFLDTSKFKQTRGLFTKANSNLEIAQLGSGVPPSNLYPIDVPKALSTLSTLRQNTMVHFWKDGADLQNQLGTGEIAYSLAFSNRVTQGIQQGLPLDMTFNQSLLVASGAAIPATAKNVDGAVAFLDYYMQPEVQAAFAKDSGLAPAYPNAAAMVDPSVQKYMVTFAPNLEKAIKIDNSWWLKNLNATSATFTAWKTGR